MSITPRLRGGVYVDGFNLYHSIDDLRQPYLKWLSLQRLAARFARGHAHSIDHIVFGTAFFPSDFGKRKRHEKYIEALEAENVTVLKGHTTKEPNECKSCGHKWDQPREKETDINVALSMYHHAISGQIDVAFLISADTDQAATLRFMQRNCPNVRRIVVTPYGRDKSKHLRDLAHSNLQLSLDDLDSSVLPKLIHAPSGKLIVAPQEYHPDAGWVHPDDRPRK